MRRKSSRPRKSSPPISRITDAQIKNILLHFPCPTAPLNAIDEVVKKLSNEMGLSEPEIRRIWGQQAPPPLGSKTTAQEKVIMEYQMTAFGMSKKEIQDVWSYLKKKKRESILNASVALKIVNVIEPSDVKDTTYIPSDLIKQVEKIAQEKWWEDERYDGL